MEKSRSKLPRDSEIFPDWLSEVSSLSEERIRPFCFCEVTSLLLCMWLVAAVRLSRLLLALGWKFESRFEELVPLSIDPCSSPVRGGEGVLEWELVSERSSSRASKSSSRLVSLEGGWEEGEEREGGEERGGGEKRSNKVKKGEGEGEGGGRGRGKRKREVLKFYDM